MHHRRDPDSSPSSTRIHPELRSSPSHFTSSALVVSVCLDIFYLLFRWDLPPPSIAMHIWYQRQPNVGVECALLRSVLLLRVRHCRRRRIDDYDVNEKHHVYECTPVSTGGGPERGCKDYAQFQPHLRSSKNLIEMVTIGEENPN